MLFFKVSAQKGCVLMMMMDSTAGFEDWQLSRLDQFLEVTHMHDIETAVSLLKSYKWDVEKAVEERLLDNLDSLSVSSSSASDFVIIDRNDSPDSDFATGMMDSPGIFSDANWKAALTAPLPDDSSDSNDSCEVISLNEGADAFRYGDTLNANTSDVISVSRESDQKVNFILGGSPLASKSGMKIKNESF